METRIVNNNFIADIKEKCSLFNSFFAEQCTLMNTDSLLPNQDLVTNLVLDNIFFSDFELQKQISRHIRKLNINKAHGFDWITIRMLKICDTSISKPLCLIFKKCIEMGYFPQPWKWANIIPIHKKNSKQDIQNHCYQFVVKFLKQLSLINFIITFSQTTS